MELFMGLCIDYLRIPAKDWTDPRAASDYLSLFNQEIVQAELKARGGDLGVRRVVKYKGAGIVSS